MRRKGLHRLDRTGRIQFHLDLVVVQLEHQLDDFGHVLFVVDDKNA